MAAQDKAGQIATNYTDTATVSTLYDGKKFLGTEESWWVDIDVANGPGDVVALYDALHDAKVETYTNGVDCSMTVFIRHTFAPWSTWTLYFNTEGKIYRQYSVWRLPGTGDANKSGIFHQGNRTRLGTTTGPFAEFVTPYVNHALNGRVANMMSYYHDEVNLNIHVVGTDSFPTFQEKGEEKAKFLFSVLLDDIKDTTKLADHCNGFMSNFQRIDEETDGSAATIFFAWRCPKPNLHQYLGTFLTAVDQYLGTVTATLSRDTEGLIKIKSQNIVFESWPK